MATLGRKRRRGAAKSEDEERVIPSDRHEKRNKECSMFGACVNASSCFEKVDRLGEGTYGVVYQARDRVTGRHYALKRCIPHHEQTDGFPITTLREIQTLKTCVGNPHIVQLSRVAVSKSGGVFLVLEYCEHDLAKLIDRYYQSHRRSPFCAADCKSLTKQLLQGVAFLHSRHLLHRDLKMSNLLYHRGCLKIADFGLSRPHLASPKAMTPQVASLWYRSPEILFGQRRYSYPMDVWATGCLMGEFILGVPLFQGKSEMDQMKLIVDAMGRPTPEDWCTIGGDHQERPHGNHHSPTKLLDRFRRSTAKCMDVMLSMMHYDPNKRAKSSSVLKSAYFSEDPLPTKIQDMPQYAR